MKYLKKLMYLSVYIQKKCNFAKDLLRYLL